jgi:DNA polymerase I-like protein with 3'-5' exonuclease and polymerase domains
MRLLICDAEKDDVKAALSHLKVDGPVEVLLNPQWLTPDPDQKLWVACGKPAVDMVQAAKWIPKKGGVEANRGKLWQGIQPQGWTHSINLGITYAPQVRQIDVADWVKFETDIALYRRFEKTGSMDAVLGDYRWVSDLSGVIEYCKRKHAATGQPVELALDTETEGLDPFNPEKQIVCIQATACAGMSDLVYTKDLADPHLNKIIEQVAWLVSQPWIRVIGANFKYDMLWLRVKWGVEVKNFAFDTCNGGSLVDENRPNTLNIHTKVYTPLLGGYDDPFERTHDKSKMGEVPPDDLLPYAGGDTDACFQNYFRIREELVSDNLTKSGRPAKNSLASVYLNIVHPTLKALHKMEHTGVCVDTEKFHEFGADLENRMAEATKKAVEFLPKSVIDAAGGLDENGGAPLSKPKMIANFLFGPNGLNLKPTVTTEKTGAPSTAEYHLAQFKDHPEAGPLIQHYLDYKATSKMHGTYYKGFLEHLRSDNRWHASYIIHKQGKDKGNEQDAGGTVTGRGSAVAPAFQCVSGDTEILTPGGITTAEEIINPIIPEDAFNPYVNHATVIWGGKGWETTSNVFRSWRADLVRVRLRCGNDIVCTPEHPLLCNAPVKARAEWVQAQHIQKADILTLPEPVDRPDGPDLPEVALEALGVIAAAGYIAQTGDNLYIEVAPENAGPVERAADALGFRRATESVTDGDKTRAVVRLPLEFDKLGKQALQWLLWLPHPVMPVIPYEVRGTKAWWPVLRGILSVAAEAHRFNRTTGMKVRVNSRSLVKVIAREALLDGIPPPLMRVKKDHFCLEYRGHNARATLEVCGHPTMGCDGKPYSKSDAKRKSFGLMVTDVEPAGAGWVYDFTLPKTHAFSANGLTSHNTVPKHSYWGKRIRECIIAPPGHVIVARDYSQGELKVAACWAGETKMIDAYLNGIDLHTLTAATVNGMTYEEAMALKEADNAVYKALRQNGKAGNFGLLYAMQAYGFMMYADAVYGVKLTLEEAEAMREAFFELYPGLPLWHDRQIMEAQQTGMVRSPLGRLRHLPNINSPIKAVRKKSQNQAINSPIQGTLVDMMWWSMGIIEEQRPELLIPCAQVHDQGIWYAPEDRVAEAIAYSGEVMENLPFEAKFGWKPELQFTSDAEVGLNLADLKEVA